MPQFDYQQLCHFVLPEQGGLSVETILKRFLHLTPREIRHAKYIPDGNSEKRCFLPHKCSCPDWRYDHFSICAEVSPPFRRSGSAGIR